MQLDKTGATSYAASALIGAVGMMTLEHWALVVTMLLGVGTFIVNWRSKRRMTRIRSEEADASIKADNAKQAEYEQRHRRDDDPPGTNHRHKRSD